MPLVVTANLRCPWHTISRRAALAEDLERWLRHEPIHARPARPWEVAVKWARRKPALAGFLVLAAAAPAIIIAVLLLFQARLHQEQALTEQERNKARQLAEQTRLNLYAADIFSVHNALQHTNLGLAKQVLSQYLPRTGQPDIRGFEWHWLWHGAQGDRSEVRPAHSNHVSALAFSPDGHWLASAGNAGWVRLFDRAAGQLKARLRAYELEPDPWARGHEFFKAAYTVSFSPDNQFLACDNGSEDCPCCIVASWVRVNYCPPVSGMGAGAHVKGVNPSSAGSLQEVQILGNNLGTNADNLCIMQVGQNGVRWPLRALWATGDQIGARTTPMPTGAITGPLVVMAGQGVRGPGMPVVWNDLIPGADGWFFRGIGQAVIDGSLTPLAFQPPPNTNTTWLTGSLVNGTYTIFFSNACPADTVIDLRADLSIALSNRTLSADQAFNGTVWTRGGTALDCAKRVCDLVVCGLASKLGVRSNCQVTPLPDGVATVTLSAPVGTINYAYVGVCLTPPPPRPAPVIFDVFPATGTAGDIITISGANLGNDPNNLCAVVDNGSQLLPLQVLTAQDNQFTAQLPFVPVGAQPGPVMVALGNANLNPPVIRFPDMQLFGPFWAWGKAGNAVVAPFNFVAVPGAISGESCVRAEFANGQFCLLLTNNWPTNVQMSIIARGHNAAGEGADTAAGVGIYPSPGSTPLDCARRLAAILSGEFIRQSSIAVVTTVDGLGGGLARVCIAGGTQPLTSGWFSICFKPLPNNPPTITCPANLTPYSTARPASNPAAPSCHSG